MLIFWREGRQSQAFLNATRLNSGRTSRLAQFRFSCCPRRGFPCSLVPRIIRVIVEIVSAAAAGGEAAQVAHKKNRRMPQL